MPPALDQTSALLLTVFFLLAVSLFVARITRGKARNNARNRFAQRDDAPGPVGPSPFHNGDIA